MKFISSLLVILVTLSFSACNNQPTSDFSVQQFKNPPTKVHLHTWWHWMDGRITREGITRDLESMKKEGISQATILNIGMTVKGSDVPKVIFNTKEWYEMFQWALQEAKRLNITIGVHNCDGWSESGGPWISPEMSMKKFVFSKTRVTEESQSVQLPKPLCDTDFYQDVAVVAFPGNTNKKIAPATTILVNDTIDGSFLDDGNPESMIEIRKHDRFLIENPSRATKTKLALLQNFKGAFYFPDPKTIEYTLKASDNGIHFKELTSIATNTFYSVETTLFPPSSAKYFQVEVSNIHNLRPWHHAALSELQLLGEEEEPAYYPTIRYPLEKAASARIIDPTKLYTTNQVSSAKYIIQENSIIDLTDQMQADGTLNWQKPSGSWTVIRFGYTTTGATNGPATKEGRGLECDKLDTAAVNLHFRNFPEKLLRYAGDYTGNTFKFLMIDSWERGYQTWTRQMPEEFKKYRGYSLLKWIPVLCGETVESTLLSEGFLYDFRKTIADLFEQNYYRHFNELCHQNKLELHGEVIYGDTGPFPPIDVLSANNYMDMPMYEFWADANNQQMVDYKPVKERIVNFPVFASNFYNKPVIGAEAYTGFAHYSESPADLKEFGDRAYCSGINQFILHSYVHQPSEQKPGITLGQHGSHFNRNNPYWNYSKSWLDYQSRIQYILQQGAISSDILYFLGDQLPQFLENKTISQLPDGYMAIPCNLDILKKLTVKKGKIYFSKAQQFSLLVLPDQPLMSYETLIQIERLLKEGAVIYGEKPYLMFSKEDRQTKSGYFTSLTNKIWNGYHNVPGRNTYGKGTIIWKEPIDKLLNEFKLKPDFTTNEADSLNWMYIHKNTENRDLFFVFNQQDSSYYRECVFNVTGRVPSVWNPLTGEVNKVAVYTEEDGQTKIPVTFHPGESFIFIFTEEETAEHVSKIAREEIQIFPATGNQEVSNFPEINDTGKGDFSCFDNQQASYSLTTSQGRTLYMKSNVPTTFELNNFNGQIIFHHLNSNSIDSLTISEFQSFTDFQQPTMKYFAGVAEYQIDFTVPQDFITQNKVLLSLGAFDATGEIILNGKSLGTIWNPNSSFQVDHLLKAQNHLEIKLATTCRNRIIGDLREYGDLKNIWTSAPVQRFLNKDSELKPSGIISPICLIKYE